MKPRICSRSWRDLTRSARPRCTSGAVRRYARPSGAPCGVKYSREERQGLFLGLIVRRGRVNGKYEMGGGKNA